MPFETPPMHDHERIFVQIASYRDPDCQTTINDLFAMARRPERIFVGVCLQVVPDTDRECLLETSSRPDQVRIKEYHVRDARGVCWARHQTQKLWAGEEYTLQIDSHMRFEEGWDEALLQMLRDCPGRSVLTTYPPGFTPPRTLVRNHFPKPTANKFDDNRILIFGSFAYTDVDLPAKPMQHAFLAAGFVFAPSSIISEVPYDPLLYFNGEEASMAARLWTHGYDLYAPNRAVIYHNYERQSAPRHWSDDKDWGKISDRSFERFRHLFGTETAKDADAIRDLDQYSFGKARSLADYERFTGISFKNLAISDRARSVYFPFRTKEESEAAQREGSQLKPLSVTRLIVGFKGAGINVAIGHKPRLAFEAGDLMVYDDFLPSSLFTDVQAWAAKQAAQSPDKPCINYVAGSPRPGVVKSVYPSKTPLDLVIGKIVRTLPEIARIVGEPGKSWNHFSASYLDWPRGEGLSLRKQDNDTHAGRFIYFLPPAWNVHWGGLLMAFEKESVVEERTRFRQNAHNRWHPNWLDRHDDTALASDQGVGRCILPRPNRVVFLNPDVYSSITPITDATGKRLPLIVSGDFWR